MVFTSSTQNRHIPVMLMETLENLKIKENGIYVDGTIGLGGHSEIIIKKIDTGLLIGIDRDKDSISIANKRILALNSTEFAEMEQRPIQISGRIQKEFIGISINLA